MLRRLGIRGKVLAALSVPVLVLFGLAGLVSWQAVQDVRSSRAVQDVLDALEQSQVLASALQDERSVTLQLLGPLAGTLTQTIDEVRSDSDTAINRFNTAASRVDFDALDPTTEAAFERLSGQLGFLDSARSFADSALVATSVVEQQFNSVIRAVVAFPNDIAEGLTDRQLAVIVAAGGDFGALVEAYEREQVLGREAIAMVHAGEPNLGSLTTLAEVVNETNELRGDVAGELYQLDMDDQFRISETILITGADLDFAEYRRTLSRLDAADVAQLSVLQTILPTDWETAAQTEIDALGATSDEISALAANRATAIANAALREAALSISITALAVILSIIIALSIARAIVGPVRRLTDAATSVRDELPHLVEQVAIPGQGPDLRLTKIPIESRDEIGSLAAAFNEVNATTIEVAQEQAALRASIAEMFVNVARRDQVLLNRQLSFIDALERSEEDPKALADLFRLDHLATRMRRNSESLLVLAGIDTGRRLREPLPTSDVIRTASSEIEHYERIQLELPVDPMMLGHTALPTAHMLAEILENATVFSDPGTPVHVSTGIDETAVIITVQDQGLGMTPEELNQANARLKTSSASDVLGAQRLGLYVVGRIAARLGASVHMGTGPDGKGTLVTVRMPLVLFVNPGALPITPPTAAPARVESFVPPEEAAAVGHETAFALDAVQDVPAGALGSIENPAEEVDIASLVEGTTQTGLPKRRSHADAPSTWDMSAGDAAAASAIPLAPNPDALAGAAMSGAGEVWQPPVIQPSAALSPRRRQAEEPQAPAASSGLPQRQRTAPATDGRPVGAGAAGAAGQPPVPQSGAGAPTASGLPTRRPAPPIVRPAHEAVDTASAGGPANVEGRTAMFAGFRSRRAELAAAAIHEAGEGDEDLGRIDAVDRLAATATGAAAFFQRPTVGAAGGPAAEGAGDSAPVPAEEPMTIPALVEDEDEYGDAAFAPAATDVPTVRSAEEVPFEVFTAAPAPAWSSAAPEPAATSGPAAPVGADNPWPAPAAEPVQETPWVPAPAPAAEPVQETPWAPAPVAATAEPAWTPRTAAPAAPTVPDNPWTAVAATVPTPGTPVTEVPAWETTAPAPSAASAQAVVPAPVDFAELVHGPTRRSLREQPGKRRWFRRSRRETAQAVPEAVPQAAPQAAAPVPGPAASTGFGAPAVPAPTAEPAAAFSVFAPTPTPSYLPPPVAEPVRQSAWGAPTAGSHAVVEPAPEPVAPFVEPQAAAAAEVPAPVPAPFAPRPPVEESAAWQPAPEVSWTSDVWQQPAAFTPDAPPPARGGPAVPPTAPPPIAAPVPVPPAVAAPTPVPAAPSPIPEAPAPYGGPQTFTPQPMFGFDEEMTNMLAQRADIAEQALAELNQLSTYRPQAVSGSSSSKLQRRTPNAIPAAPAISTSATPRPARDANQVRSLLSSFQTGTSRGRELSGNGAQQTTGENGHAGSQEDPDGRGEPVPIPDADLSTRETSW